MNASGDAAESIVRMSLQGFEVAARISGSGAKNIAALIYTIMKDNTQTKGKTRLTNMLKSGKELKVFTVKEEDLKKFTIEAKRYGVLFCALKSKGKSEDGIVDIMVRAEDASKINRIVERYKFTTIDTAYIKNNAQDLNRDKILNLKEAKIEKNPLLEPTLKNKSKSEQGAKLERSSVREEIKQIRQDIKADVNNNIDKTGFKKVKVYKNNKINSKNIKERG